MKIKTEVIDTHTVLNCPDCKGSNLHNLSIGAIYRDEEDGEANDVFVAPKKVNIRRITKKEQAIDYIESRRSTVYLKFSCENCPGIKCLKINQHKGHSLINWE